MSKKIIIALFAVLAFGLVACQPKAGETTTETTTDAAATDGQPAASTTTTTTAPADSNTNAE